MRIAGKRVKRLRWIHTERYVVVAVEVEAVIPVDDPSEPCYESESVQLLREVEERANLGQVEWLRQHVGHARGQKLISGAESLRLPTLGCAGSRLLSLR